jgi:hypothetical protein
MLLQRISAQCVPIEKALTHRSARDEPRRSRAAPAQPLCRPADDARQHAAERRAYPRRLVLALDAWCSARGSNHYALADVSVLANHVPLPSIDHFRQPELEVDDRR